MSYKIVDGIFRIPADLPKVPPHPVEIKETFYNRVVLGALKGLLRFQKIKVTVIGAEHIPLEGGALLAMNHTGYYDFIFGEVPAYLRGRRLVRFMAKKEVFDTPVVGHFMRSMDHVSVDRSAGGGSVDEAIDRIRNGQIVGIFPEATISRSFELKDFKTGAVRIADHVHAPLIPMVTWGSQRLWSKGAQKNLGRSGIPIHIQVGAPVDPSGNPEEATQRLKEAMQELLDQARQVYEAEHGPFEPGLDWMPADLGGSAPTLAEADRLDADARAARQAKKEEKAKRQTRLKLDRRADAALGNARSLTDRVTGWLRR